MLYTEIPTQRPVTPLLDSIDDPHQLRQLAPAQLKQLADELRLYLLYSVGQSGGHFGANLGVVELTIALHYCFNTPHDRIVWDVGHQAYAHKILTGRREQMTKIRAKDGLTAFPSRHESPYDTFGVGHSSTAISAALGMFLARRQLHDPCEVVAVVGDGAMTAGMAFEAMNDAVAHQADIIVILNDNDMSISCSTGGLAQHLATLWGQGQSIHLDNQANPIIQKHPEWQFTQRLHEANQHTPDNLFKAIGFEYFGPFDGHDLTQLQHTFQQIKKRKGPRLVHIYTQKGKGFAPAEADPIKYHALSKITQSSSTPSTPALKYADVFGQWLCDEAAHDERLLAITPAMCEGSGMVQFAKHYPTRFFDVAIAEQHAVTLAAGMACEGLKPVVAIYSTFLQRGYDQLIHDVALQNLDVTFAIDRAGLVGEDGATHAGAYDYAYMRTIPNMVIFAPKDENECRHMLHTAYHHSAPTAVRYPRGTGIGCEIQSDFKRLTIGQGEIVAQFNAPTAKPTISILAFGSRVYPAIDAAQQLHQQLNVNLIVANMRFVKPLDHQLIAQLASQSDLLITVEEHAIMGGAGSAVNEYLAQEMILKPILNLGLADEFLEHGSHDEMLEHSGLDSIGIQQAIAQRWQTLAST